MKPRERDSGMEVLRIFAILLVICVHMFSYGGFYDAAKAVGGHVHSVALLMKLASRAAVDIFLLITGYFMVDRPFDLKKGLQRSAGVYQKMLFYSVVLTIIFLCLGSEHLIAYGKQMPVWQAILKGIFPVTSQTWYFLSDYLLLCLLMPFLNLALQMLTKKEYRVLVIILVLLMSVWAVLLPMRPFNYVFETFGYKNVLVGKNIFHFVFIYILGGYISFYTAPRKKPNFLYLAGALGTIVLNYLLFTRLPGWFGYQAVAQQYSNPLVIANAVFLLLFFRDVHFRSRLVNLLASTTLGVYAISEFRFLRTVLWKWIHFEKADVGNVFKNVCMVALAAVTVFLACALIDLLRVQLFRLLGGLQRKRRLARFSKEQGR